LAEANQPARSNGHMHARVCCSEAEVLKKEKVLGVAAATLLAGVCPGVFCLIPLLEVLVWPEN